MVKIVIIHEVFKNKNSQNTDLLLDMLERPLFYNIDNNISKSVMSCVDSTKVHGLHPVRKMFALFQF